MQHRVRVKFLYESAGGRKVTPTSGYKPTAKIADVPGEWSLRMDFFKYWGVMPGTENPHRHSRYALADIEFVSDIPDSILEPSDLIRIYEGPRLVAVAQKWPKIPMPGETVYQKYTRQRASGWCK